MAFGKSGIGILNVNKNRSGNADNSGSASAAYFRVFNELILTNKDSFRFEGRNRRPPLDNVNALLSFAYALLANDCASALEGVGLDSYVGFKYYWLYRVKFGVPETNLATKGDSITFSTPTIEGTILRRNKLDGNGKHPWKAEVTEGDANVAAATISGWYTQVYEPTFTE